MEDERVGRMAGKVALVSGGARGLGEAQARLLAAHGARVVIGDVDETAGQSVVRDLLDKGDSALFVRLDVVQEGSWQAAVAATERAFGALNVLVNNAGVVNKAGFEDETLEGWTSVREINETGVFLGIRTCAPAIRRAGGGAVVNLASISGFVGQSGFVAYQASKGAVRQLTKAAAMQYAPDRIRVNSVAPGVIMTDMFERTTEEYRARRMAQLPLGRFGEAREVAQAVLFLASDESSYITGVDLLVDGGLVAQ